MSTIRKEHSLTGRIDPALMLQAFQKVKRNCGAAGIDRVSLQMFQNNLQANLTALQRDLKRGTFRPKPSRRRFIEKPGSDKLRPLGIPAVRDRIAQEVGRRLLSPIFEPLFHENSYGFRHCRVRPGGPLHPKNEAAELLRHPPAVAALANVHDLNRFGHPCRDLSGSRHFAW